MKKYTQFRIPTSQKNYNPSQTIEQPFLFRSECPLCGKTFKVMDWLKDHIRRGHNYTKQQMDELILK